MARIVLVTVGLALAALVVVGLLIFLVALAFLGLGTLVTYVFELTLFEATTVTLLGAIALVLLVHLVRTLYSSAQDEGYEDWDEDVDEEWLDGDWYEDWDEDIDEDADEEAQ